jgi:hypothetical protein
VNRAEGPPDIELKFSRSLGWLLKFSLQGRLAFVIFADHGKERCCAIEMI